MEKNSRRSSGGSLEWEHISSKTLGDFRIFTVRESLRRSPLGVEKRFSLIDTHDWAMVLPVTQDGEHFVMVRQWRHGSEDLSIEFPGGVLEEGESPEAGAARELREETGLSGKLTLLGRMNPNPAIMSNSIRFFLARDLSKPAALNLDEDEFIETLTMPINEVIAGIGRPPFPHALTAAALFFYIRQAKDNILITTDSD